MRDEFSRLGLVRCYRCPCAIVLALATVLGLEMLGLRGAMFGSLVIGLTTQTTQPRYVRSTTVFRNFFE